MKNSSGSIFTTSTIKDALLKMKNKNIKHLLIINEDGTYFDVLSWQQIIEFYLSNIDIDTSLKNVIAKSENRFISEKEVIQKHHFSEKEYIIIQNNNIPEVITKTDRSEERRVGK